MHQQLAASYEDNSRHISHPRPAVSQWPLRKLPAWLQLLVAVTVTGYCGAICAAAADTRVQAGQLRLFVLVGASEGEYRHK